MASEGYDQPARPGLNGAADWIIHHGHWLLLGTGLLVVLTTFTHYGITWDERVQSRYGELVLDYFLSGFQNRQANDFLNLRYYGPVFELACAAVYRTFNAADVRFEIRHLMSALTALLALWGVWKIGRTFQLPGTAILALLGLAMIPRFYGHAFINSKDIPFACAFVWAMVAIITLLTREGPQWRWRDVMGCGLAIGATLAIRMGGLLVVCFLAAALLGRLLQEWPDRARWLTRRRAWQLLAMVGLAWSVMVIFWPWAHQNPLRHPWEAFVLSNQFSSSYRVLYGGEIWQSDQLPATYMPWYLLITLPPFIGVLALAGLVAGGRRIVADWRSRQALAIGLTCLWCFFPIGYVLVQRPNIYDGIRHFLFVLPAIALLAGFGGASLVHRVRGSRPRLVMTLAVAGVLLLPIKDLVALHPYQMTYFNSLAGGLERAWRHYETDYWSSSYKEAMEWINGQAARQPDQPLTVVIAANRNNLICASYYAAPNVRLHRVWSGDEPIPKPFDYYVGINRYGMAYTFADLPIVHTVGRQGAVFTVIRSPHAP